jgi:hypothetical protein
MARTSHSLIPRIAIRPFITSDPHGHFQTLTPTNHKVICRDGRHSPPKLPPSRILAIAVRCSNPSSALSTDYPLSTAFSHINQELELATLTTMAHNLPNLVKPTHYSVTLSNFDFEGFTFSGQVIIRHFSGDIPLKIQSRRIGRP